ncbi:hypothetical protein R1flu_003138 [Riccia fluitans]|uniref:Uncharacterized protein n=1 Tax=Riccia fluitans TaxID=41844 RepID=A0ABD1Y845_9MARC
MSKIARLEATLLAEIHESRVTEEKLRSRLAKSRVVTKDLQARLSKVDQGEQANLKENVVEDSKPVQASMKSKSSALPDSAPSSANPPVTSSCSDLRQLARNQVIRCVQDISPQFTVDLQFYSYGGYIPWPRVLDWLEDHPETVDTIGLNLHSLRTI